MGTSKAAKRDKNRQLIAGIKKHFAKTKTLTLKGQTVKLSAIVSGLNASIAAGADTDAKRTVYLEAAKTSRAKDAAIDPVALSFTEYLISTMSATVLADFNLSPRTRTEPDVATKALANAKRSATRKARGTLGPREKQKITGATVASAAPAAPATQATPAPKATPSSPAVTPVTNGGTTS